MIKVAIHGVPRSGTTWLGAIFDSSPQVCFKNQPLFSYKFKGYLSEKSTKQRINNFFSLLEKTPDPFMDQVEGKDKGTIPMFSKESLTHIVYKEARYHNILSNLMEKDEEVKVVGIVRSPKSVLSSWYHAPKEFNQKTWNFMDEWENAEHKNLNKIEEFYGYNKWKEVLLLFLDLKNKYPKRFFLIKYSDLLCETESMVRNLFDFCELKYSSSTEKFIKKSKSKDLSEDAYSVYRANQLDDKWKDFLPKRIVNKIDNDIHESGLAEFNQ